MNRIIIHDACRTKGTVGLKNQKNVLNNGYPFYSDKKECAVFYRKHVGTEGQDDGKFLHHLTKFLKNPGNPVKDLGEATAKFGGVNSGTWISYLYYLDEQS